MLGVKDLVPQLKAIPHENGDILISTLLPCNFDHRQVISDIISSIINHHSIIVENGCWILWLSIIVDIVGRTP